MSPVCSPRYLETYCVLHKSIVLRAKHSNIYLLNPTIYFYIVLVFFSFEPKNWMSFEKTKFIYFFYMKRANSYVLERWLLLGWRTCVCYISGLTLTLCPSCNVSSAFESHLCRCSGQGMIFVISHILFIYNLF